MCAHITTANNIQLECNDSPALGKQENTSYKGRRGRLCGSRASKPWRVQGGPSIYGGFGATTR